jgi:hypothetical protein
VYRLPHNPAPSDQLGSSAERRPHLLLRNHPVCSRFEACPPVPNGLCMMPQQELHAQRIPSLPRSSAAPPIPQLGKTRVTSWMANCAWVMYQSSILLRPTTASLLQPLQEPTETRQSTPNTHSTVLWAMRCPRDPRTTGQALHGLPIGKHR